MRWELVEKFGWSLEYVDSLTYADIEEYYAIVDGRSKGMSYLAKRTGALNQPARQPAKKKRR